MLTQITQRAQDQEGKQYLVDNNFIERGWYYSGHGFVDQRGV